MIALLDTEKAAERHDGIGHLPVQLVQHQRIDRAEFLALTVIDRGPYDLVGGYQVEGLIRGDRAARNYSVLIRRSWLGLNQNVSLSQAVPLLRRRMPVDPSAPGGPTMISASACASLTEPVYSRSFYRLFAQQSRHDGDWRLLVPRLRSKRAKFNGLRAMH